MRITIWLARLGFGMFCSRAKISAEIEVGIPLRRCTSQHETTYSSRGRGPLDNSTTEDQSVVGTTVWNSAGAVWCAGMLRVARTLLSG